LFFGGRVEETQNQSIRTVLTAIRRTGEVAWRKLDNVPELNKSGVLTTATGLVFSGDSQKRLLVLDAGNGNEIWHYPLGGEMAMAPITYLYEGSQELAVISGGSVFVMSIAR
jgi:alcohol dehydrogenase (cytochrome c)